MNLEEKKKLNLFRIEQARIDLSFKLQDGFITEDDILDLLKVKNNFGIEDADPKSKLSILKDIFNSPFILCDQDNLSLNIKQILPLFLNCRYEMEIEELKYLLNNADITQNEFNETEELLKFCYYESSNDGKSIFEKGHVENFYDNKIKVR